MFIAKFLVCFLLFPFEVDLWLKRVCHLDFCLLYFPVTYKKIAFCFLDSLFFLSVLFYKVNFLWDDNHEIVDEIQKVENWSNLKWFINLYKYLKQVSCSSFLSHQLFWFCIFHFYSHKKSFLREDERIPSFDTFLIRNEYNFEEKNKLRGSWIWNRGY